MLKAKEQMKTNLSKYFKGDLVIWVLILVLAASSMLTVYSATGTLAYKKMGGNTSYYLFRQLAFLIGAMGVTYIVQNINYTIYFSLSRLMILIALPLLVFTATKGVSLNQASRWITIPGIGLSFQTSDVAKLALVMFITRLLSTKQNSEEEERRNFKKMIGWTIVICGLIGLDNFSTAAILFAICVVLMFIGRVKISYLLKILGVGIVAFVLFLFVAQYLPKSRVSTWKSRIESFLDEDNSKNFQANCAKTAIVNGGIKGLGPGNSIQRNVLPHPYSDFIYAIIIEEYGLVGGLIIMLIYLTIFYRVIAKIKHCRKTYPALLAIGLMLIIISQAMINMAVAVNLFPVTGQTLPFVSMGGTSIIMSGVIMGIIFNILQSVNDDRKKQPEAETQTKKQTVVENTQSNDTYVDTNEDIISDILDKKLESKKNTNTTTNTLIDDDDEEDDLF